MIYKPKGKAREYSPLAINLYDGCNFGCKYCYAPKIRRKTREEYNKVNIRKNIIEKIKRSAKKHNHSKQSVLFCFMHDPYLSLEIKQRLTQRALKIFYNNRIPVSILTKAGTSILRDLDIFKKYGKHIQIGATLTFFEKSKSLSYEPKAAIPEDRIKMLKILKNNNIKTWASFEPVINPQESIKLIKKTLKYIDIYKIGKINHYKGIDKTINWTKFLKESVKILRENNKNFYIKKDLRANAPGIKLYGNEVLMDEFQPEPFPDKLTLFG